MYDVRFPQPLHIGTGAGMLRVVFRIKRKEILILGILHRKGVYRVVETDRT